MLKVELHAHTADDPVDRIPHTAVQLIDRAAQLGYGALAITLHERQLDVAPLAPYAAARGVTLIPGVERTIEGRHVLLLNFRRGAEDVNTFDDLARLRQREAGLVVAPHPFFPLGSCLRGCMDRHAALFDAAEVNALFTGTRRTSTVRAQALGRSVMASRWSATAISTGCVSSARRIRWLTPSRTPTPSAPRLTAGRLRVESRPMPWTDIARVLVGMALGDIARWLEARGRPTVTSATGVRAPRR